MKRKLTTGQVSALAILFSIGVGNAADWAVQSFAPGDDHGSPVYLQWDANPTASGRRLMVSNSPETISTGTGTGTLWWDGAVDVGAGKTSVGHRTFLWHVNDTSETRTFALTVQNRSATNPIQIASAACTTRDQASSWLTAGKEIALAGLTGLGAWIPENTSIGAGQTKVIWRDTGGVADNHLIGGLFEFTVQRSAGTGYIDYVVRSVECGTGDDPTSFADPLPAGGHVRGTWPYSDVSMSNYNDPFIAAHPEHDLGFADSYNSPNEMGLFSAGNGWGGGTANTGLYGVKELATLWTHAPGCSDISGGRLYVWARKTGDPYAGACQSKGIPSIIYGGSNNAATVSVKSFQTGYMQSFIFTIMHAGAATLPVAIEFRWY